MTHETYIWKQFKMFWPSLAQVATLMCPNLDFCSSSGRCCLRLLWSVVGLWYAFDYIDFQLLYLSVTSFNQPQFFQFYLNIFFSRKVNLLACFSRELHLRYFLLFRKTGMEGFVGIGGHVSRPVELAVAESEWIPGLKDWLLLDVCNILYSFCRICIGACFIFLFQ